MRHDKLERELHLLMLLTDNHTLTIDKLCDKVGISRRNLYYYLEFFRDTGFVVYKRGKVYCIDRDSPFFGRLVERVSFTADEAVLMRRLLDKVSDNNAVVANLKRKMDRFYDFDILDSDEMREQAAHNVSVLHEAIKTRRQVLLRNYSSPHSNTCRDRLVEPFMLMNGNNEVRCHEPASGMNKTFKVARMEDVTLLEQPWQHEGDHRRMYTDIFMFSGEELYPVTLSLGSLSYNVLKEEYPSAARYITPAGNMRWNLSMNVCSHAGIGRFVLGLYEDIEVLGDDAFKAYLKARICRIAGVG